MSSISPRAPTITNKQGTCAIIRQRNSMSDNTDDSLMERNQKEKKKDRISYESLFSSDTIIFTLEYTLYIVRGLDCPFIQENLI